MSYNESLSSNSNYPRMSQSDWDNAPWNEIEVPEKDFDITCSQTLSKSVKVTTNDYDQICNKEWDNMGGFIERFDNTENTNWAHAFANNEYHTPAQLLVLFKMFLKVEISNPKKGYSVDYLKRLAEECDNWTVDDEEFAQD